MPLEVIPKKGLRAALKDYSRLKAFHSGGLYWDIETQQLVRSSLGRFLPTVEQGEDSGERFGIFKQLHKGDEVLWKSVAAGSKKRIPLEQLKLLEAQLLEFRQKAELPEVTPNNKEIIRQFKLPDFDSDPELYRLVGPFWNRRLFVLWGCESKPDSSLSPTSALLKLPTDSWYRLKRWLLWLILFALLAALLYFLIPFLKHRYSVLTNKPPIASLSLAELDESNHVAVMATQGSYDPDGSIEQSSIDWGDGNHDTYPAVPSNLRHKYLTDGDYNASLTCIDNLGAASAPSLVKIHLDFDKKLKAAADEARSSREEAELKAKKANDELAAQQASASTAEALRKAAELAAKQAQDELAAKKAEADAKQLAREKAKMEEQQLADRLAREKAAADAKALADAAKTNEPPPIEKAPVPSTKEPKKDDPTKAAPDSLKALEADKEKLKNRPVTNSVPSTNSGPTKSGGKSIHIEKVGSKLLSDGTMEVNLAAKDETGWDVVVPIQYWLIDGKKYPGGPEFNGNLTKGTHSASVHFRGPSGIPMDVGAEVTINIEETKKGSVVINNPK